MRILFWQEQFRPQAGGGVQVMTEQLLARLRRRGHEVAVVTRRDSPELPRLTHWRGIPVHRLPFWQALDAGRASEIAALRREVAELKRALSPQVIHVNGLGPSVLFHLETGRACGAASLIALHSSNTLSAAPTSLARRALEGADWVVACSRALLNEATRAAPAIAALSSVVYNGARPPASRPVPPPAEPRILCLGTLSPHKGFDLALRALPALLARFPGLRVTIAGEGPARCDLERLAAAEGVRGAVDFVGPIPHREVFPRIEAATVVAVPSRRESFGLVALEAALMRRPVVAARTGGLAEVVAHGETGLLVEPESSEALAGGIALLLERRELAEEMGAAARRRARREFDLAAHVAGYEQVYRCLAAGRGAGSRAPRPEVRG